MDMKVIVVAKEVRMDKTIRALVFGALILAAALIPIVISAIQKIAG